jgi:hypothetical protein
MNGVFSRGTDKDEASDVNQQGAYPRNFLIRGLSLVIAGDRVSQLPINIGHTHGDDQ